MLYSDCTPLVEETNPPSGGRSEILINVRNHVRGTVLTQTKFDSVKFNLMLQRKVTSEIDNCN